MAELAHANNGQLRPLLCLLDSIDQSLNHVNSEEVSIKEFEHLRSRLRDTSRAINHAQNQVTPAARLPNELLCQVFTITLNEDSNPGIRPLCNITRVCRRWRNAAIDHACLWSHIRVSMAKQPSIERAFVFLKRSKGVSLQLRLEILYREISISPRMEELMDQLALNGQRIKEFTINADKIHPDLQRKLQFSVPNLESFRFRPHSYALSMEAIHPSLFGGQIPNLKSLDMTGISSWPSGLFKNLTEIALCINPSHPIGEVAFLQLLQDNPGLQKLKVTGIGLKENSAKDLGPVSLPHFTSLWIQYSNSRLILSRLVLPASVSVVLRDCVATGSEEDEHDDDTSEQPTILASLPTQCSTLHFLDEISRLQITFDADTFEMTASNQHADLLIEQNMNILDIGEYNSFPLRSWEAVAQYPAFHSIVSLELTNTATASGYSPPPVLSQADWETWLEHLSNLKQLIFHMADPQNVLQAFFGGENPTSEVLCPQLLDVDIHANESRPGKNFGPDDVDPAELQRIIDFSQARINVGKKLQRLKVKLLGCKRHGYWAEKLRDLAEDVQLTQG